MSDKHESAPRYLREEDIARQAARRRAALRAEGVAIPEDDPENPEVVREPTEAPAEEPGAEPIREPSQPAPAQGPEPEPEPDADAEPPPAAAAAEDDDPWETVRVGGRPYKMRRSEVLARAEQALASDQARQAAEQEKEAAAAPTAETEPAEDEDPEDVVAARNKFLQATRFGGSDEEAEAALVEYERATRKTYRGAGLSQQDVDTLVDRRVAQTMAQRDMQRDLTELHTEFRDYLDDAGERGENFKGVAAMRLQRIRRQELIDIGYRPEDIDGNVRLPDGTIANATLYYHRHEQANGRATPEIQTFRKAMQSTKDWLDGVAPNPDTTNGTDDELEPAAAAAAPAPTSAPAAAPPNTTGGPGSGLVSEETTRKRQAAKGGSRQPPAAAPSRTTGDAPQQAPPANRRQILNEMRAARGQ